MVLYLLVLLLSAQHVAPSIHADASNRVHVRWPGATRDTVFPGEPAQVGIADATFASDGKTAAWLALFANPNGAEPIAMTLIVARGPHVIQRFTTGQVFWSWSFVNKDRQTAFHTGPKHGETASHCELHALPNGRLLGQWDGDLLTGSRPRWTSGLRN